MLTNNRPHGRYVYRGDIIAQMLIFQHQRAILMRRQ